MPLSDTIASEQLKESKRSPYPQLSPEPKNIESDDTRVILKLDAKNNNQKLEDRLHQLKEKMSKTQLPCLLELKKEGLVLSGLEKEFKSICQINKNNLTEQEKLTLEEYKLAIIKAIQNDLVTKYKVVYAQKKQKQKESTQWWRWLSYVGLIVFDMGTAALGASLGIQSFTSFFFPDIPQTLFYTIVSGFIAFEAALYCSVMAPILKKALGIEIEKKPAVIFELEKQLEVLENINQMLGFDPIRIALIPHERYKCYVSIVGTFNDALNNQTIKEPTEGKAEKVIKWILNGANAILTSSHGFFIAKSLLKNFIIGIALNSPAGYTFVSIVIIGTLINRFVVRSDSVFKMLHPLASKFKSLKEKLEDFLNQAIYRKTTFEFNLKIKMNQGPKDIQQASMAVGRNTLRTQIKNPSAYYSARNTARLYSYLRHSDKYRTNKMAPELREYVQHFYKR